MNFPVSPRLAAPRSLTLAIAGLGLLAGCATQAPVPVQPAPAPAQPAPTAPAVAPGLPVPAGEPIQVKPLPPVPAPAPQTAPAPARPAMIGEKDAKAMIARYIPAKAPDRMGWAGDIYVAFATMRITVSPQNICSAVAVIEQESSFQADPVVPGLGNIVWQEVEKKAGKYHIPLAVVKTALLKPSKDGRSYKSRIDGLRTEKEMDELFHEIMGEIPHGEKLFAQKDPVKTAGPMQVSVDFAREHMKTRPYPYRHGGDIRPEVFTRHGGVYFGVADLLDYPVTYSHPIYRFADYNGGRYSSRNAAFQSALALLAHKSLAPDGDLLRYDGNNQPSRETSATQKLLYGLTGKLGMGKSEIDRDLRLEKEPGFAQTPLYQRLFALADKAAGRPLTKEMFPRIDLKSPKIHHHLTTEWFAHKVDAKYQACLARVPMPTAPTPQPSL